MHPSALILSNLMYIDCLFVIQRTHRTTLLDNLPSSGVHNLKIRASFTRHCEKKCLQYMWLRTETILGHSLIWEVLDTCINQSGDAIKSPVLTAMVNRAVLCKASQSCQHASALTTTSQNSQGTTNNCCH